MLKSIFSTTGVRLSTAVIGLFLLTLNGRMVGPEGLGEIRIFTVTVTILIIVANFIGGPNLIYRASRHKITAIILRSYVWSGMISLAFLAYPPTAKGIEALLGVQLPDFDHHLRIAICTFFYAMAYVNTYILLGLEDIRGHNITLFSFSGFLLLGTVLGYSFLPNISADIYIQFFMFSAMVKFGIGWLFLLPHHRKGKLTEAKGATTGLSKTLLSDGAMVQSGNFFQQINYRIGDYILESTWGLAAVGLFSAAVQLSEGIWTISRSAALVQYSKLSNLSNVERGKKLTYLLSKGIIVITAAGFVFLSFLPISFYTWIFGEDFTGVRGIIRMLAPVLTLYSVAFLYSHFFASQGDFKRNTFASFSGMVLTLIIAFILIPKYGIVGVVITQSITYTFMLFILGRFMRLDHPKAARWMFPGWKDYRLFRLIKQRKK
jgi:O-antigen/teichoic acid export membrane protein